MKILQALFFPPEQPGGVSSMVPYIQDRFQLPRWEMELFSLPKRLRGKGQEEIAFATFDWTAYGDSPIVVKYIQTIRDYIWWTRRRITASYDLIHAHHPIAGWVMKRLFPETAVVLTVHSSYERELLLNGKIEPDGPEFRFLTSLYGELEAHVDLMMTVSNSFRHDLAPYVARPERIEVLPNGFDEKRFRPIAHENEVPQLIVVCRLVPAKGLDVLLRACAELKRRGRPYVLHIIGDGPIREELEQLAQELGIYEETIFYGYMLHPEEFMPFSDIFVLPSRAEAFGSVFAEAALCGLALVGTNVGGIAEQITDGVNGLLVPVDDPDALAAALERVMSDPAFRYELSRTAWTKAKQDYSLSGVVNDLKRIYLRFRVKAD
ncbi:glycosyltransferase family 4 protein [Paenibacillus thiaminolyticus]|uniref:glycosyltransferase family 4 protein n=1 Tax=Paenibacillus thiaminolyticus TaxID=49283 RepID=UPI0011650D9C|nr:glycosyltransferase family 4 protein [Paenibacillus thiaminolyticus]MDG0874749.1 glycosyltransferase family 4 protein [Paenibacillus thiaminolyticus]NGP57443.1 glycosyltransferase family 4 protein [Paenibacillus thiaminolyticus]